MSYVGVPLTRGRSASGGSAAAHVASELSSESEEQSVVPATSSPVELFFERVTCDCHQKLLASHTEVSWKKAVPRSTARADGMGRMNDSEVSGIVKLIRSSAVGY